LKINMAGICEYCHGKLTSGEFDWVLSRIEQDVSYGRLGDIAAFARTRVAPATTRILANAATFCVLPNRSRTLSPST
jgi:hypothetical protein